MCQISDTGCPSRNKNVWPLDLTEVVKTSILYHLYVRLLNLNSCYISSVFVRVLPLLWIGEFHLSSHPLCLKLPLLWAKGKYCWPCFLIVILASKLVKCWDYIKNKMQTCKLAIVLKNFKQLLYFFRFCSSAATFVNWGISFKFPSALLKIASAMSERKVLLTMFLDRHTCKQTREMLRLYQK